MIAFVTHRCVGIRFGLNFISDTNLISVIGACVVISLGALAVSLHVESQRSHTNCLIISLGEYTFFYSHPVSLTLVRIGG